MSNIRAGSASLKDPDDDYAFQLLKGDVERIRLALENLGLVSSASVAAADALSLESVVVKVAGVDNYIRVLGTTPTTTVQ